MEPRVEEKKSRFRIKKLEERIAPACAATFGLNTAYAAAIPHVSGTPAPVEHVVETVTTHNPQFCP
jgi:hypothetical protein